MKADPVAWAAYNNALWCDAICRANGKPGEFHERLWLNRNGSPRFYPDAVTLSEGVEDSEIVGTLADLVASHPQRGWAIKDSFSRLDLAGLGFRTLFDANWLFLESPREGGIQSPADIVERENDLALWERAWAGHEDPAEASPFSPVLLGNSEMIFASVTCDGVMAGGGILNGGGGVIGISNVFANPGFTDVVWRRMIALAARQFPGMPLVGYEQGPSLVAACRNGFEPIGPLRIWIREDSRE